MAKRKDSLQPVCVVGPMSADTLQILYVHVMVHRHAQNHVVASRKTLHVQIYVFLPRVRMVQTCTNAYIERGQVTEQ